MQNKTVEYVKQKYRDHRTKQRTQWEQNYEKEQIESKLGTKL
jgi:hypothetical protein